MTNPFYAATDSIVPFTRANANVLQGEFIKVEQAFDEVNAEFGVNRLAATSSSTVSVGTGSKTFLASTRRSFSPGQFVIAASTASVANYMLGQVTAYDGETGSLTINVLTVSGSGSYSSWAISQTSSTSANAVVPGQLLVGIGSSAYKADINGTLHVSGDVTFDAGLEIFDDVTIGGDLGVTGNATVGGDLDTTGDLSVGGASTLGNTDVTGFVSAVASSGSTAPISGSSTIASLPSGSFTNSGSGSSVFGVTSSISSTGNNTSSYHYAGITQSVALWYLYGNGTTSYTSDVRAKKNITTARDGYLEEICQLRVVKYNWYCDDDSTPKEMGLIAQEVEQVFPSLVQDAMHPTQDGEIRKVLKGSVFTFLLIKALQEANIKIDDLADRVAQLEG